MALRSRTWLAGSLALVGLTISSAVAQAAIFMRNRRGLHQRLCSQHKGPRD
jgi:hypothetical protein